MKHFGDIQKIKGNEVPPVWCITGGSPCQDLSVAGKRKGLQGERSGLFMEQIRIVKEMRNNRRSERADEFVPGRYLVWENVDGARSSNFSDGFGDFGAVLEEIVRIRQPGFSLPRLEKKQKWTKAGAITVDGFSVAWRLHDAQYWGVPQRRKRICIVADFNGYTAADIVFERVGETDEADSEQTVMGSGTERRSEISAFSKSLSRDSESCESQRKEVAGDSSDGTGTDDCGAYTLKIRGGAERDSYGKKAGKGALIQTELSGTLGVSQDQYLFHPVPYQDVAGALTPGAHAGSYNGQDAYNDMLITERCLFTIGHDERNAKFTTDEIVDPLTASDYKQPITVAYSIDPLSSNSMKSKNPNSGIHETEVGRTLDCTIPDPSKNQGGVAVCYGLDRASYNQGVNAQFDFSVLAPQAPTVIAKGPGAVCEPHIYDMTHANEVIRDYGTTCNALMSRMGTGGNQVPLTVQRHLRWIVRRLTPLECERLQGFPDRWTDIGEWTDSKGKKHKDAGSPRYKALGNSIALPYWFWMMNNMAKYLPANATMASLFDGIGGFPMCWETIHGKGTAVWASEIEEFPIAVTKLRFPEENVNE